MFNGILFQQSLQDLVKGIRSHRRDETLFIRQKCVEIAAECRSKDPATKANAVLKLTHLHMLGYNMAFASFHVVEVMCTPDFASKRIGYLAAAQSFSPATDVLLLTTNQFKKDLTNGRMQDSSLALTCLAKLVTDSLARDLTTDVAMLLSSPRPYIRKKALLVLYRFITVYPETLSVISTKFRTCLADPDPSVVCAAVTVTCELARASPRDFLGLAPALYALLTSSTNNWMLIKIVKLMGTLTPLEPRLGKKLVEPLINLMTNTRAKSLLYECCATVTLGLLNFPDAVALCGKRLGDFMVDTDQNLKYLGLLSMRRLASHHPDIAMQHRDLILDCLDDVDTGIRMRALDLVSEFVTRRTLRDITRILLRKLRASTDTAPAPLSAPPPPPLPPTTHPSAANQHVPLANPAPSPTDAILLDPETPYRDALADQLLVPGTYVRGEGYPLLSSGDDFAWYAATVLGGLARSPRLSAHVWQTVALQLIELIARVEAVRPATVAVASALLSASAASSAGKPPRRATTHSASGLADALIHLNGTDGGQLAAAAVGTGGEGDLSTSEEGSCVEAAADEPVQTTELASHALSPPVLASAAWVVGENASLLKDRAKVLEMLLAYPAPASSCPAQVALLGSAVKVYASCTSSEAGEWHNAVLARLREGIASELAEVHERALLLHKLVDLAGTESLENLRELFQDELLPVDARAQANVPVPEGLDLDQPLLDTGGMDLYSYLASNSELSALDESGANDGGDGDEDDLFTRLEQAGDLTFGSRAPSSRPPSSSAASAANVAASPFHLGGKVENLQDVNAAALFGDGNGPERIGSGGGFGAGNSEEDDARSDQAPVRVLVDKEELTGGKSKKSRRKKEKSLDAVQGDGRYGTAFQGLFNGPVAVAEPSQVVDLGDGKKKKRKKKSKQKKLPEAKGADASLSNLIDFGAPSASQVDGNGKKVKPAHLGDQADLLL